MSGFLRPLRRPGSPTRLFEETSPALDESESGEQESTVMQAIMALQAKQEALQADLEAQIRSNEMLRREVELLKSSGKAEYGASR